MTNGRDNDAVLVPEIGHELVCVDSIDRNDCESPSLSGFEAGMQTDPRMFLQFVRPAQCQVAQSGSLSLDADRLLEGDGFVDRRFGRRRAGADLFEFPNILGTSFGRRL